MTDTSPRLGLIVPTDADPFVTEDIANNWGKIDAAPGEHICTSTTRPSTWTSAQAGRHIFETDTGLTWWWDGTQFRRKNGSGLLKTSGGAAAYGSRTTDFTTTSTTPIQVVSISNVVVPAGTRPLKFECSWYSVNHSATGAVQTFGRMYQSATNNSGPVIKGWNFGLDPDNTYGAGGAISRVMANGLAAGTYNFSFQVWSNAAGTLTIPADAGQPIEISVVEL